MGILDFKREAAVEAGSSLEICAGRTALNPTDPKWLHPIFQDWYAWR